MRKILIAAASSLCMLAAAAAEQPLQCVNPEILNGIVFSGQMSQKVDVMRGLPASMGVLPTPAGFTLIGSAVRGGDITQVGYRTSLDSDKAYAAVMASLNAQGWRNEPEPGSSTFKLANGPRYGTACRDGERRQVMVADVEPVRYVNILAQAAQVPRACNTTAAGIAFPGERGEMPAFRFPAGTSRAFGGSGGGGSDRFYTTSSRIISKESPASLVAQLASQIRDQGWTSDAGWSGTHSAGSTWRKSIDGQLTWGMLEIAPASEDTYDVTFTLARAQ